VWWNTARKQAAILFCRRIAFVGSPTPGDETFTENLFITSMPGLVEGSHASSYSPVSTDALKAIPGSQCRASFRLGEIHVLDSKGHIDRVIPFNDTNREL
jgi:hypothetical protein